MKNKNLIYLIFLIIFSQNILNANDFIIESSELSILEKGNITKATNGVKIVSKEFLLEISGNINEINIIKYAKTGVDYISIGALTHSVKNIDLSLKA